MNALLQLCRLDSKSVDAIRRQSDRIKREVSAELASTQHSALGSVTCNYENGMLQLLGEVNSYYLKQLAQERARRVDGVSHVINSIHVVERTNPTRRAK